MEGEDEIKESDVESLGSTPEFTSNLEKSVAL